MYAANSYRDLGHFYYRLGYILMNQVTRRHLKRLEMDDYDLGHLDSHHPGLGCGVSAVREPLPRFSYVRAVVSSPAARCRTGPLSWCRGGDNRRETCRCGMSAFQGDIWTALPYNLCMEISFDPTKDAANIQDRGIPLAFGASHPGACRR